MTPQDPTAQDRLIGAGTKLCDCCRNLPSQCTCQPVSDQPTAETLSPLMQSLEMVKAEMAEDAATIRRLTSERDAARAELERVKADFEFIRNNRDRLKIVLVEAGKDADRLRADLAAALEERDAFERKYQEQLGQVRHFEFQARIRAEDNEKLTARAVEAERARDEAKRAMGCGYCGNLIWAYVGSFPMSEAACADALAAFEAHDRTCERNPLAMENKKLRARVAGLPGDGEGN